MANHPDLLAHQLRLINSTYEQLEDEMTWLANQSNLTAEILHQVQLDYQADVEVLEGLYHQANLAVNQHLMVMTQPFHLDQLTPALHVQEQEVYNQLLGQRDQTQDAALRRFVGHHNDCRRLDARLREINFWSTLVTLAHLIKVDRQDLV